MRVGDNTNFPWELGNGDGMVRLDVRGPLCANETEHAVDAALRGVGFVYCLARRVAEEVARGELEVVDREGGGSIFTMRVPAVDVSELGEG